MTFFLLSICYVDPNSVYPGFYLNRYFRVESLKNSYSHKHGSIVGNVFPLLLESINVFYPISMDEFSHFMKTLLTEKTGSHATHCCMYKS